MLDKLGKKRGKGKEVEEVGGGGRRWEEVGGGGEVKGGGRRWEEVGKRKNFILQFKA